MPFLSLRRPALALLVVLGLFGTIRALGPHGAVAQDQATTIGPVMVSEVVTPVRAYIDVMALPEAPPALAIKAEEVEQLITTPLVVSPAMLAAEQSKGINLRAQVGAPAIGLSVTPPEFAVASPNFPGIGYTQAVPPDPNGAVGPNHYVQIVNTQFAVWNKSGGLAKAPVNINTLWSSQPTSPCFLNNEGDPVALYDHLADRWLISQFALHASTPSHECVAISPTSDPTAAGTWLLYDFSFNFAQDDYPKLGVWPDGYYFSSQRGYAGGGIDVAVFDRVNMLNGNPATLQTFHLGTPTVILLPGDLSGPPPPPGTPNPFARPIDGAIFGGGDRVEIWEFHVDWGNPLNSTFGAPGPTPNATLTTDPFISGLCSPGNLFDDCITQPPSPTTPNAPALLESLNVWPMGPLQYRNFGSYETLVFNHTVNATGFINNVGGATRAGVHWYEIRRAGGVWSIHQESTFAPATNDGPVHRWMGSVAMDQAGNMALGYSTSSSTDSNFPSIRYVGRLATDPLDEMSTTENTLVAGTDSQVLNGDRWGDYSAMRVDPADGCTFWYTTQYSTGGVVDGMGNPGGAAWGTRIGAFRFPTCNQADLAITKVDSPDPVIAGNQLNYTITVTNNGPSPATQVVVTDQLPTGVVFLSSSIPCTGVATKTCNIGSLASGASTSFTIQVRIPANFLSSIPASTTDITNTASVTAHEMDPNLANNTVTASTNVIESADVGVSKICKPDGVAQAGTNAFCDIFVANAGPSDAQHVIVVDRLSSNAPFTIISVTGASCTLTNPVTCNLGTLAAGGSVTIRVTVSSNAGGDVNDLATVSSSTPDPDLDNNSATGKVSFSASADLSIAKTAAPKPVIAGTNLTYVITVGNAGPSAAANLVVKDTLPAEVSVLTVTPSVGSCTAGFPGNPLQPLTCTMDSLASGGSATITIVAKVSSAVPNGTVINNNATISSAVADPNNANNSATAATTVNAQADLVIVKTSDAPQYKPSSTVAYTVTVTNNGPSDALAVIVTDTLPTIQQAHYLSDTGGCTLSGLILTCNLGNMPVGTSKSFNIYEKINGSQGVVPNTATVNSSTTDPIPANNTSTRTVTIGK
jgi:uncharacterized repeat protein (TIGR01451 family)